MLIDAVIDTLVDGVKLLPFLFLTYLVMEYIEHKAGGRAQQIMQRSGNFGPVIGGILGVVPQCGFSAAASNLYAGRIITLGTLFSVFLSTSDEMLPIFISEKVAFATMFRILAFKAIVGIAAGLVIDFVIRKTRKKEPEELRIDHLCEHQHCHCGEGKILQSAVSHTLQVFGFILIISLILNLLIGAVGQQQLASFISTKPVLGPVLAGLVGLIPNCASSVVLTQLYLEGVLGAGAMIGGLLAGQGVGLLVLYSVNDDLKENIRITVLLYVIGVAVGIITEMLGIAF